MTDLLDLLLISFYLVSRFNLYFLVTCSNFSWQLNQGQIQEFENSLPSFSLITDLSKPTGYDGALWGVQGRALATKANFGIFRAKHLLARIQVLLMRLIRVHRVIKAHVSHQLLVLYHFLLYLISLLHKPLGDMDMSAYKMQYFDRVAPFSTEWPSWLACVSGKIRFRSLRWLLSVSLSPSN